MRDLVLSLAMMALMSGVALFTPRTNTTASALSQGGRELRGWSLSGPRSI